MPFFKKARMVRPVPERHWHFWGGITVAILVLVLLTLSGQLVGPRVPLVAAQQGNAPTDVVFIIDESGSMGNDQAAVRLNVQFIADALSRFLDPRFALVGFGANTSHGSPDGTPHTHTDFTDVGTFTVALDELIASGGYEPGVAATTYAMNNLSNYRFGAAACAILITDEDSDGGDLATARAALDARNATWFGIVDFGYGNTATTYGPDPGSLSEHSGGDVFDIDAFRNDPTPVLEALLSKCIVASALPPGSENFGDQNTGGTAGDPVNTGIGNFVDTWIDLAFPSQIYGLNWARTYNSLDSSSGVLGPGWTTSFSVRLSVLPNGDVILLEPDGRRSLFSNDGAGGWTRPSELFGELVAEADGSYAIEFYNGQRWAFDAEGTLVRLVDWSGQVVDLTYDGGGHLRSAVSSTGHSLAFTYNSAGYLAAVTANDGRSVSYGYNAAGALEQVNRADGSVESYETDELARITRILDGTGQLVIANVYGPQGRVVSQTYPSGNTVTFDYNDETHVTVVTDGASGDVTVYTHDENARLLSITDANGSVIEKEYDADGNLIRFVDRRGGIIERSYDNRGNLLSTVDANGAQESFVYDDQSRLIARTGAAGGAYTYSYSGDSRIPDQIDSPGSGDLTITSANGLVLSETDADGVTTTYTYDSARNLTAVSNGLGETTTFDYDAVGRRIAETTPLGFTTTFAYDGLNRVVAVTDPLGSSNQYSYDAAGRLLSFTDATGAVSRYSYDARGYLASETDPNGAVTTYNYNNAGDLVSVTRPGGATFNYSYGALARLEQVTDPTGRTIRYEYDASGNLVGTIDASGARTTTVYDAAGRPVSLVDPLGNTYTQTFDGVGQLLLVTDPLGATTTYIYDADGNLVEETDARGAATRRLYTPAGRLQAVIDALGNRTTFTYDAAGRQITTTFPEGGTATTTYDADGRIVAYTTPAGLITRYSYDAAGRLISVDDPQSGLTTYTYTPRGEVASETDASGASVHYAYDPAGRLIAVVDANSGITTYEYDARGNPIQRSDALGHVETWTYDLADRLLTHSDPLGRVTTYSYDETGRLATAVDATGRGATLAYDAAGRLLTRRYTDGSQVSYSYDAAGRRITMADVRGTTTYVYDAVGNMTGITYPDGRRVQYAYDLAGNRTGLTYPDRSSVSYSFDSEGRLVTVSYPELGVTHYEYNADGYTTRETLPQLGGYMAQRSYEISESGQLSRFTQSVPGAHLDLSLGYDGRGLLTSVRASNDLGLVYGYDPARQLLQVESADKRGPAAINYTYDEIGRRTAFEDHNGQVVSYRYDAASQLLAATDRHTTEYTYDAAGRRTEEAERQEIRSLVYDARGLPVRIESEAEDEVWVQERVYDGDGRLVTVMMTDPEGETSVTDLLWDISLPVPQVLVMGEPGADTNLIYGINRIGAVRADGSATLFAYDHLGSAIRSRDTTDLVAANSYDAFGRPEDGGNDSFRAPRFGYRGELHIGGLIHLRARDYDPTTGLFITRDPLDGVVGRITIANPYHYADNNPLNRFDPLGLRPTDADLTPVPAPTPPPAGYGSGCTYPVSCLLGDGEPVATSLAAGFTVEEWEEYSARHNAVQRHFITYIRPGAMMEVPIPGSGPNGGTGRADLVWGNEIWEVKPYSALSTGYGQAQLLRYISNRPGSIPGAFIPRFYVPYGGGQLVVDSNSAQPGMLYYWYQPRRTQPEPVPVPVPVPVPAPNPDDRPAPGGIPEPVVVGGAVIGTGVVIYAGWRIVKAVAGCNPWVAIPTGGASCALAIVTP